MRANIRPAGCRRSTVKNDGSSINPTTSPPTRPTRGSIRRLSRIALDEMFCRTSIVVQYAHERTGRQCIERSQTLLRSPTISQVLPDSIRSLMWPVAATAAI